MTPTPGNRGAPGTARPENEPLAMVERLRRATNDHDLDALVACFAPDYRNETPSHPERGFIGREQVRKNWTQIFAAIPDVTAEIVRCAVDGDTVWTEWEHRGTRPDGSAHVMRGVVIFGVVDGVAAWARFYLEPVQEAAGTVDDAVRRQVAPGGRS
jgi:ketosteroid isomerase-like protein